jgi:hypothetical protein
MYRALKNEILISTSWQKNHENCRTLGLRTVRITVTAVQFTDHTDQLSNFDGTVRYYGTGIRPFLRINYHSLKIALPKAINLCLSLP